MTYMLLSVSVFSMILQNCILNFSSKKLLKDKHDTYVFNTVQYAVVLVIFIIQAISQGFISWYSVILGAVFGIFTVLCFVNKMFALSIGPMHITTLIATSSLIIPALSGIFFGEKLKILNMIAMIFLLFFLYLSLGKTSKISGINVRWILFCIPMFITTGALGVLQKVHQSSIYKKETAIFLASAFLFSWLYSFLFSKKEKRGVKYKPFNKKMLIPAVLSGFCIFAMNIINLYLSGVMTSQLFFPLVNGTFLIASCIVSVFWFKESLSKRQVIGISGGFICLLCIACL